MGSYTITDDLRPWVEATAPTMTRDGWREAEDVAVCTRHDAYVEDGGLSPEEAAALLAYRAEVADCLACFEGDVLVAACDGTPKPWGAAVGAAWEVLRGWRLHAHAVLPATPAFDTLLVLFGLVRVVGWFPDAADAEHLPKVSALVVSQRAPEHVLGPFPMEADVGLQVIKHTIILSYYNTVIIS